MPVYNGERFINEAIDSLLAQSFEDFELIISDNASTDGTEEICQSYAARDRRLRYFRNAENIGVYRNINRVIQLSSGGYFKLACADDFCHPDLIKKCLEVLDSDSTIVASYAKACFIDQNGEPVNIMDPGWHLMSNARDERMRYVITSGHYTNVLYGLMRANDLAFTRLFPDYAGGDCRLLGELCLRGKFYEIPEALFFRRIHGEASSQNTSIDWQSKFYKGRSGCIEMPYWHICADHCLTILRSNLSFQNKFACLAAIMRRMYSAKRVLLNELSNTSKYVFGQF
jgi:glycosyltransferase involved in cell wall biosynthesis